MIRYGWFMLVALSLYACGQQQTSSPDKAKNEVTNIKQVSHVGRPLSGEQLFIACQACHSLTEGAEHKLGPNLFGIIGQAAASRQGYSYSKALSESGLIWTESTLTGWVLATENVVPGTWMAYHNHLSPDEVVRLVEYISAQP